MCRFSFGRSRGPCGRDAGETQRGEEVRARRNIRGHAMPTLYDDDDEPLSLHVAATAYETTTKDDADTKLECLQQFAADGGFKIPGFGDHIAVFGL